MKFLKKKPWIIIALVVLAISLLLLRPRLDLTVFSVSKVEIDPLSPGYVDPATDEWKGSFWVITMLTDLNDQVAAIKLTNPTGEPGNTYVEMDDGTKVYADDTSITGQQLIPQSSIEVKIDPQQPYWERAMEIQQVEVAPKAYGAWANAFGGWGRMDKEDSASDQVTSGHYEWAVGSWEQHTPFTVYVLKDGVQVYAQNIDTVGGTQSYRLPPTGNEYVHLTDLGKIGTGYGEPQIGNILYFTPNHIFEANTYSRNIIKYDGTATKTSDMENLPTHVQTGESYSNYWFGNVRWDDDNTPAGFTEYYDLTPFLIGPDVFGGWELRDDWHRNAVTPPKFPGNKPSGKEAFMSLIEYLDHQHVSRVAMPSWLDRIEIVNNKMRLYLPFGSASSLVTVKISTEIADTIVWQPLVADFDITNFPDFGDIADTKTSTITVQCVAGEGSGTIWFTQDPGDAPLSIVPTIGTGSMTLGESKTFDVEIINLGTELQVTGKIIAEVTNSLGTTVATAEAGFTLLEKTGALTVLTVLTTYDSNPVSGIPIIISWAEQSRSGTTDTEGGGIVTWELGSYGGNVDVTFTGNQYYKPDFGSITVTSGVQETYEIELVKWDEEEDEFPWYLLSLLVIPASASIVVYYFWKRKRNKRRKNA